jgi:hypothetical protein
MPMLAWHGRNVRTNKCALEPRLGQRQRRRFMEGDAPGERLGALP